MRTLIKSNVSIFRIVAVGKLFHKTFGVPMVRFIDWVLTFTEGKVVINLREFDNYMCQRFGYDIYYWNTQETFGEFITRYFGSSAKEFLETISYKFK